MKIPKFYQPPKGAPREQLAYMTPWEMDMLRRLTDGRIEMTRHGIPSFRLDDQDTKDMNSGTTSTNYNSGGTGPRGPTGPGGEPRTNYSGTGGNPNISVGTGGTGPRGPTGPNGEPRTNYSGTGGNANIGGGGNASTGARGPTGPNGESKTNYQGTGGNPNINVSTSGNAAPSTSTASNVANAVNKVVQDVTKLGNTQGSTAAPPKIQDRIMAPAPITGYESYPLDLYKTARPWMGNWADTWSNINTPTTVDPVYDPQGAVPQQMHQAQLAQDAWQGSTIQNAVANTQAYRQLTGNAPSPASVTSAGYIGPDYVGSLGDYGQVPKQYTDRVPNQQKDQSRIAAADTNYNASLGRYGGPFETAYSGNPNPVGAWDSPQPAGDVMANNAPPSPPMKQGGGSVNPAQYSGPAQNIGELGNKFTNAYDRAKYGKENLWSNLGSAVMNGDFRNPGNVGSGGEANSGAYKYGDMAKGGSGKGKGKGTKGGSTYTPPAQPSFTDWYAANPWKYPEYTQTWAFTPFGQYWPS